MAKYVIRTKTIAAIVWIERDGILAGDAVYLNPGEIEYFVTDDPLPIEVRNAITAHFKEVYAKGLPWLAANFVDKYNNKVVATIDAP